MQLSHHITFDVGDRLYSARQGCCATKHVDDIGKSDQLADQLKTFVLHRETVELEPITFDCLLALL